MWPCANGLSIGRIASAHIDLTTQLCRHRDGRISAFFGCANCSPKVSSALRRICKRDEGVNHRSMADASWSCLLKSGECTGDRVAPKRSQVRRVLGLLPHVCSNTSHKDGYDRA